MKVQKSREMSNHAKQSRKLRSISKANGKKNNSRVLLKTPPKKSPAKQTLNSEKKCLRQLYRNSQSKRSNDLEEKIESNEKKKPSDKFIFPECFVSITPINLENLSKYSNKRTSNDTFGIEERYPQRKKKKNADCCASQYIGPFDSDFIHNIRPNNYLEKKQELKNKNFKVIDYEAPRSFKRFKIIMQRLNPDIIRHFSKISGENIRLLLYFIYDKSLKYVSETELMGPNMNYRILVAQRKLNSTLKRRIYNFIHKTAEINLRRVNKDLKYIDLTEIEDLIYTLLEKYITKNTTKIKNNDSNKNGCKNNISDIKGPCHSHNIRLEFDGFDVYDVDVNDASYEDVLKLRQEFTVKDKINDIMDALWTNDALKESLNSYISMKNNLPEQLGNCPNEIQIVNELYDDKLKNREIDKLNLSNENETFNTDNSAKRIEDTNKNENKIVIDIEKNQSNNIEISSKKNMLTELIHSKLEKVRPVNDDLSNREGNSSGFDCSMKEKEIQISKAVNIDIKNKKSDTIEIPDKNNKTLTESNDVKIKSTRQDEINGSKNEQKSVEMCKTNSSAQNTKPDILDQPFWTNNTNNDKSNTADCLQRKKAIIPLVKNIQNNKLEIFDGSNVGIEVIESNKNKMNENDSDNNLILQYLKAFRFGISVFGTNKKNKIAKTSTISVFENNKKKITTNLIEIEFLRKNIINGRKVIFFNFIMEKPSMEFLSLFFEEIHFNQNINIHELYKMAMISYKFKDFSEEIEMNIFDFGLRIIAIRLHIKKFNPKLTGHAFYLKMLKFYQACDFTDLIFKLHKQIIPFFYQCLSAKTKKDWFRINGKCLSINDEENTNKQLLLQEKTSFVIKNITMELNDDYFDNLKKLPEDANIQINENVMIVAPKSDIDFIDLTDDSNDSLKFLDNSSKGYVEKLMIEILKKNNSFFKFLSMCSDSLKLISQLTKSGITTISDELIQSNSLNFVNIYINWVDNEMLNHDKFDLFSTEILKKMTDYIKAKDNLDESIIKSKKIIESEINQSLEKLYAYPCFMKEKDNDNIGYSNNGNRPTIKIKNDLLNKICSSQSDDIMNSDYIGENTDISFDIHSLVQSEDQIIETSIEMEETDTSNINVSSIMDELSTINVFDDLNNMNVVVSSNSDYNINNDFIQFRMDDDCPFSSDIFFENSIVGEGVIDVDCEDILASDLPNMADDLLASTSHYNVDDSTFNEIILSNNFDISILDPQQSVNQMLAVNLNLHEVKQDEATSLDSICEQINSYAVDEITAAGDIDIPMVDDMPIGFDNAGVLLPS